MANRKGNIPVAIYLILAMFIFIIFFGVGRMIRDDDIAFCKKMCTSNNSTYEDYRDNNCFCNVNGSIRQITNIKTLFNMGNNYD